VTPVDVLKLYLSTNLEDLSDTIKYTEVILIYKHGRTSVHLPVSLRSSMFVDKSNFSTYTSVTEVFHVCR
jgi:hypothetical protein